MKVIQSLLFVARSVPQQQRIKTSAQQHPFALSATKPIILGWLLSVASLSFAIHFTEKPKQSLHSSHYRPPFSP